MVSTCHHASWIIKSKWHWHFLICCQLKSSFESHAGSFFIAFIVPISSVAYYPTGNISRKWKITASIVVYIQFCDTDIPLPCLNAGVPTHLGPHDDICNSSWKAVGRSHSVPVWNGQVGSQGLGRCHITICDFKFRLRDCLLLRIFRDRSPTWLKFCCANHPVCFNVKSYMDQYSGPNGLFKFVILSIKP